MGSSVGGDIVIQSRVGKRKYEEEDDFYMLVLIVFMVDDEVIVCLGDYVLQFRIVNWWDEFCVLDDNDFGKWVLNFRVLQLIFEYICLLVKFDLELVILINFMSIEGRFIFVQKQVVIVL